MAKFPALTQRCAPAWYLYLLGEAIRAFTAAGHAARATLVIEALAGAADPEIGGLIFARAASRVEPEIAASVAELAGVVLPRSELELDEHPRSQRR